MTDGRVSRPGFAAGFDFARRLRDREFLELLRSHGHQPNQPFVIALDDEPVVGVISRIMENETPSPCLIAFPSPTERFGFSLLFAEVSPAPTRRQPWRRVAHLDIAPESTIGMLYQALTPVGGFVPREWAQSVRFQRVLTPA